jgi:hypothetical protein
MVNKAAEVLLERTIVNENLLEILRHCTNHEIINNTWEILKRNNPTSSDLRFVISFCIDIEVVKEAWGIFEKGDHKKEDLLGITKCCIDIEIVKTAWKNIEKEEWNFYDLRDVIGQCIDPEIRKSVWEKMKVQSQHWHWGTLAYILTDDFNTDLPVEIRNEAWKMLAVRTGITKPFNEEPLIQKMLSKFGDKFDHTQKKIMFRQICIEDEEIMKIKKEYSPILDLLVLPNYFYNITSVDA